MCILTFKQSHALLVPGIAWHHAVNLHRKYAMCRINKASTEWLDGVRKPVSEGDELKFFEDSDSAEAPDSGKALSEDQEKTAALTSA